MKFSWMQQHREVFDLAAMCAVLQVSRQGYYAWRNRPASPATVRRQELLGQIRQIHADSDQTYGSPRIHVELVERQITCCVNTVAGLMQRAGVRACTAFTRA